MADSAIDGGGEGAVKELLELVDRSRRIGADHALVVHGGGNTSAKGALYDHLGRLRDVMWVKGSGADLESAVLADFPGLWLGRLLDLRDMDTISDARMSDLLQGALVDPSSRRPSIETLLHAFVPFRHVDHVHADSVVALTKAPEPEMAVRRALGERVGFVRWVRPGFRLAKLVADMAGQGLDGVVLAHHGLVTWADESEECWARTQHFVALADNCLRELADASEHAPLLRVAPASLAAGEVGNLLLALRGALSRRSRRVLHVDVRMRGVADREDLSSIVAAGVATADHMLRIRPWAVVVRRTEGAQRAIDAYEDAYRAYFLRHSAALASGFSMHDPAPVAVLVPGLGAVTSGVDARSAHVAADILEHTTAVAARALDAFGSVSTMDEDAVFEVDYWPLELYKLTLSPPDPPLAGHVVCVTGAASGIGRAIASHLGGLGAHLVLGDRDGDGLDQLAGELHASGLHSPVYTVGDLSDESIVGRLVSAGVRSFGGVDGFVVNAGAASVAAIADLEIADWRRVLDTNLTSAMLLTRAAFRVLRRQGLGGSIVYVASKNAFGPGAGFGAYSVSKAGMVQLMRVAAIEGGPEGIRANAVNPDAVFDGSKLWTQEVRRDRAAVHGIAAEDLEAFYAQRNLLRAQVSAEDVAQAVAFLLSEQSCRTTGAVLPVDGGVPAAFPR